MHEPAPVVTLARTTHHSRKFRVQELALRYPDGTAHSREIVRHPGAVAVLPVLRDADGERIVLIRSFRASVARWVWEIPAGTLEPGEDPAACAHRELEEEAGYRAGTLGPIGLFLTSPGLSDEWMHAYIADRLAPSRQHLDEGELARPVAFPTAEVVRMVRSGEVADGKSMLVVLLALDAGLIGAG